MGTARTRLVPRFGSVDILILPQFESWLADHAAHGRFYRKHDLLFLWFQRGEPKAVRYRLDVISPLSPTPDEEKRARAEELGWQYVDRLGSFSLYAADDPNLPEFHTDPVTQSYTMDTLARKLKRNLILLPILLVMAVALFLAYFFVSPPTVLDLVEGGGGLFLPLSMLLEFFCIGSVLIQSVYFLSLRKKLRAGLSIEHRAPYRAKSIFNFTLVLLSLLIATFSIYCTVRFTASGQEWSITAEQPAPIAFDLTVLETDPAFSFFPQSMQEYNQANYARSRWTPAAPKQYFIHQTGGVGEHWPDGRRRPSASLSLDYYEIAFPALVTPFFDALVEQQSEWMGQSDYTRHDLSASGFDRALLLTQNGGDRQVLLATQGNRVVLVDYSGEAKLADQLPTLISAMAAVS